MKYFFRVGKHLFFSRQICCSTAWVRGIEKRNGTPLLVVRGINRPVVVLFPVSIGFFHCTEVPIKSPKVAKNYHFEPEI
ncbi:MAG: hypothetical protein LBD01_00925 [Puniceicoccales bacterium]|jgi:hypothetical protein|nr:hypothetical protein [Puniceicoccales bacterium]